MGNKNKKILLILVIVSLIVVLSQKCLAAELIIDYPEISVDGTTYDLNENSTLEGIIKYLYLFALGAVGFVALLSITIASIQYILSAGNPAKASAAKDRIWSALLGILILLASVLILRTINPDLVNIGIQLPETSAGNHYLYTQCYWKNPNCNPGEYFYRSCNESFTTNSEEAQSYCVETCRNQLINLGGGVPYCNTYSNQSDCQPTGCH